MQKIPQLRADIRFSIFDEASSSRGRYLVEAGETCFAVSGEMYHLLALLNEGPTSLETLTQRLRERVGRELTVDDVTHLLESRIPPALRADQPVAPRRTPFLASISLFPAGTLDPVTSRLTWLYARPMAIASMVLFLAIMAWTLPAASAAIHYTFSMRELLVIYASLIGIALIHELGHATASQRYGCEHGDVGFGLYYIFPAFYADVTKAWRLAPAKRAVIDLGGLYFNVLTLIPLGVAAIFTENRIVLRLIWITFFIMLRNLNPVFKLDGYWLFADLSGLTNLHARVGAAMTRSGRRLLGRPSAEDETGGGVKRWLFLLYVAVVAIYSIVIIDFLVRSVRDVITTYPDRAAKAGAAWIQAWTASAWTGIAWSTWDLIFMSVWPVLLCVVLTTVTLRAGRRVRNFIEEL